MPESSSTKRSNWIDAQPKVKKILSDRKSIFAEIKDWKQQISSKLHTINDWYFASYTLENKGYEVAYTLQDEKEKGLNVHDTLHTTTGYCDEYWICRYGSVSTDLDTLQINECCAIALLQQDIDKAKEELKKNWKKYEEVSAKAGQEYDDLQEKEKVNASS